MSRIGVFDSGIGGLTVARELALANPSIDLIYLGDTARLPYGAKSPETVSRYAIRCVRFLIEQGVTTVVVACNTASAHALKALQDQWPGLRIVGVIEPGAETAVSASRTGVIGVLGTEGTIRSRGYERAISARRPSAVVRGLACPLLVPLTEAGWLDHPVTRLTIETYLRTLLEPDPHGEVDASALDTLVLGCTHYPALVAPIAAVLRTLVTDRQVTLVDSASAVTRTLGQLAPGRGRRELYVTDLPERFHDVARTFWPEALPEIQLVDLTG